MFEGGLNGLSLQMFPKERIMQAMAQNRPGPGMMPAPGFMNGVGNPDEQVAVPPSMPAPGMVPPRALPPSIPGGPPSPGAATGMMGAAVMPQVTGNIRPAPDNPNTGGVGYPLPMRNPVTRPYPDQNPAPRPINPAVSLPATTPIRRY